MDASFPAASTKALSATGGSSAGWIAFLAHLLFVLAAWTLFIKYLFPVAFALAAGEPVTSHVRWDLWPLAHVWLGWALLARPWYARRLAIVMALAEIGIIVTLLTGFLVAPEWSIWWTNWFVNKVFVLTAFVLILMTMLLRPDSLAAAGDTTHQREERP